MTPLSYLNTRQGKNGNPEMSFAKKPLVRVDPYKRYACTY